MRTTNLSNQFYPSHVTESGPTFTGYLVLYTRNHDHSTDRWSSRSVVGPETETLVGNLTSDATYHVRVQARNTIGYSPASSNTLFYTKPYSAGACSLTSRFPWRLDAHLNSNLHARLPSSIAFTLQLCIGNWNVELTFSSRSNGNIH